MRAVDAAQAPPAAAPRAALRVSLLFAAPLPAVPRGRPPGSDSSGRTLIRRESSAPYREELVLARAALARTGAAWDAAQVESLQATSSNLLRVLADADSRSLVHFVGTGLAGGGLELETADCLPHPLPPRQLLDSLGKRLVSCPVLVSAHGADHAEEAARVFCSAGAPGVAILRKRHPGFVQSFYREIACSASPPRLADLFKAVVLEHPDADAVLVPPAKPEGDIVRAVPWLPPRPHEGAAVGGASAAPPPPDLFVGHASAVARLVGVFRNDSRRGAVVTGAPGSGKTALVLHVAGLARERKTLDRVFYVDCTTVERAAELGEGEAEAQASDLEWLAAVLARAFDPAADLAAQLASDIGAPKDRKGLQRKCGEYAHAGRSQELVSRLARVTAAATASHRALIVLDSCALLAAGNRFLLGFLERVMSQAATKVVCCAADPLCLSELCTGSGPASKVEHIALAPLSRHEAEGFMRLHAAPAGAHKDVEDAFCVPAVLRALVHSAAGDAQPQEAARRAVAAYYDNVVDALAARMRKLLQHRCADAESVASGERLWRASLARPSGAMARTLGVTRASFVESLRAHFSEAQIPGGRARKLSAQTAALVLQMSKVSPLVHGSQTISAARFAGRFWPWWLAMLASLRKLGLRESPLGPLWARRAGALPVLWLRDRGKATAELRSMPVGTFSLRMSESTPGAIAVEFVAARSGVQSMLVLVEADGSVRQGDARFGSVDELVLARGELRAVLGPGNRAVSKNRLFAVQR